MKTYKNWEQFSCSFKSPPRSKFKLCPCQRLKERDLLPLEWKEIAICSVGDEVDYIKKSWNCVSKISIIPSFILCDLALISWRMGWLEYFREKGTSGISWFSCCQEKTCWRTWAPLEPQPFSLWPWPGVVLDARSLKPTHQHGPCC